MKNGHPKSTILVILFPLRFSVYNIYIYTHRIFSCISSMLICSHVNMPNASSVDWQIQSAALENTTYSITWNKALTYNMLHNMLEIIEIVSSEKQEACRSVNKHVARHGSRKTSEFHRWNKFRNSLQDKINNRGTNPRVQRKSMLHESTKSNGTLTAIHESNRMWLTGDTKSTTRSPRRALAADNGRFRQGVWERHQVKPLFYLDLARTFHHIELPRLKPSYWTCICR